MAQTPATPKARRARRLIMSRLFGSAHLLRHDAGLQASERAALALREHPAQAEPEGVTFLIPLVGQHHVKDWPGTCQRLMDTLHSLIRQTCPAWRVVICGQDRPDDLPDNTRIAFLPFTEPFEGNDKWRKLSKLTDALPVHGPKAGYAMTFDADDIAHPGLVADIMDRKRPGGYLAETGFVYDQGAGKVALAGPRTLTAPLRKPFWKLCGSCAAVRYDLTHAGASSEIDFLREMSQHEHRMFPYLAALAGRPLEPLSQPFVTYLLNHGDNFGARRGRVSFKTRFVQRYEITDPARLARIRADFDLQT